MKIKTLFLFLSFCFIFFCSELLSYYSFYSLWICVLIKLELEFQAEIGGKKQLGPACLLSLVLLVNTVPPSACRGSLCVAKRGQK